MKAATNGQIFVDDIQHMSAIDTFDIFIEKLLIFVPESPKGDLPWY